MCIDTLHIGFNRSRSRGARTYADNERAELHSIWNELEQAGYTCGAEGVETWRGGYKGSLKVYPNNNREGDPSFELVGTYNRDDSCIYLDNITARPMMYRSFEDFWSVLQAMDIDSDEDDHRIINQGYITRIDYTCDYRVPFAQLMRGLNVSRSQTAIAFEDLDNPYARYIWRKGVFGSYQIGKMPKVIRVYDKQEHTIHQEYDLNSAWDEDDDNMVDEYITDDDDQSWARIELMVTGQSYIANKVWNRRYGSETRDYGGWLRDLPNHLEDIRTGSNTPFKGILLNHMQLRGEDLDKRLPAQRIRHEIDMGLFMPLYHRMDTRTFWRTHQDKFKIYPWLKRNQPSQSYRNMITRWFSSGVDDFRRRLFIPAYNRDQRATNRWPWELTHFEDI